MFFSIHCLYFLALLQVRVSYIAGFWKMTILAAGAAILGWTWSLAILTCATFAILTFAPICPCLCPYLLSTEVDWIGTWQEKDTLEQNDLYHRSCGKYAR